VVRFIRLVASVDEFSLDNCSRKYVGIMLLLSSLRVGCFLSDSLLLMYFFFESSLVPIILLILWWGHQPEREEACFYTSLYMILFSVPILSCIVMLLGRYGTDRVILLREIRRVE